MSRTCENQVEFHFFPGQHSGFDKGFYALAVIEPAYEEDIFGIPESFGFESYQIHWVVNYRDIYKTVLPKYVFHSIGNRN